MDSPKQYANVKDRLKTVAGVDESVLPDSLEPGQELEVNVKMPQELKEFVYQGEITSGLTSMFPALQQRAYLPCQCEQRNAPLIMDAVIHLNDDCGYTRSQIADWLESLDVSLEMAHG